MPDQSTSTPPFSSTATEKQWRIIARRSCIRSMRRGRVKERVSSAAMCQVWATQPSVSVSRQQKQETKAIMITCLSFHVADGHITGTDINPYRSQAPWHAFEFAFHVLEVRANLVIVSMAWVTGEECEHFTQFPNEPDMDALTYWAQRFEPVIRDESRDEVIIVFCNRTGIEGDAVYAGTSAIIGIHEGEVKVYGVLGRGVKELLVIDTDDPPFANLVVRKEKAHWSSSQKQLKPGGQRTGDNDPQIQLQPSPVESLERTPTKYHSGEQDQKVRPDTTRVDQGPSSTSPSALKASVPESHNIPTPSAPSPTPLSARPQPFGTSCRSAKDEIGPNKHRILGGSVMISFEEDQEEPERAAETSHSALSTTHPGPPPDRPLPKLPQLSGITTKPTIFVKYPRDGVVGVASHEHGITHPQSAVCERSFQSRMLADTENDTPARPKTATGIVPTRQESSRSRETSRSGRRRERQSEPEQGELPGAEGFESLRPRSQSAMAHRSELKDRSRQRRPLSPKSRNASRSGRQVDLDQGFSERALEFYLKSIATKVKDRSLTKNSSTTQSDILVRDRSDDPTSPTSDPGQSLSRTIPSRSNIGAPSTHAGPGQSRTTFWTEISKVVGEQLRRDGAQEEIRGRRRSRSASSTEARRGSGGSPPTRGSASSPARGRDQNARDCSVDSTRAQVGSRGTSNGRGSTAPAQTRPGIAGAIRSVRDPSLGPPSDPEDEIVAEIVFRRPCCRSCGSRLCSGECNSASANAHGSTASDKTPRKGEDNGPGSNKLKRQSPSDEENEKTPTNTRLAEAGQALGLLALQTSADELSELRAPNLSRASIRTLSSYDPSPITPPPRGLEPKALRAMAFGLDQESMRLGGFEPPSKPGFEPAVETSLDGRTMAEIGRAHSLM